MGSLTLGLLFDLSLPPEPASPAAVSQAFLDFCSDILSRGARGLTLNVNSWLVQRWMEEAHPALERLQSLLRYGLVEMTGTAAHHPILPLLHPIEARRQVVLNTTVNRRLVNEAWQPAGLFPPELAYGHELVPLLPSLGFRWCLSDDANFASLHGFVPFNRVPRVGELSVLLRSRHWSQIVAAPGALPGELVADELVRSCSQWFGAEDGYLVLALPGQCLLQPGYPSFCWDFLGRLHHHGVEMAHLSHIVYSFPEQGHEVPPGSWKSSVDDFWSGDFFAPWNSPEQSQHQILWRVTELAWASLEGLREKLDVGMGSHNFEWVSQRMPPPATLRYLLDVIEAGQPERSDEAKHWLELLGVDR